MSKEIIISVEKGQTRIALIEEGELVELYIESAENARTLGDIYLGRVRRTMPSIQAAFIDIGQKQDAFLHYSDLADNLPQWLKFLETNRPQVSKFVQMSRGAEAASLRKPQSDGRSKKGSDANQDREESADKRRGKSNSRRNNNKRDDGEGDRDKKSDRNKKPDTSKKNERRGRNRGNSKQARNNNSPAPETFLDKGKPILVKIVKEPISAKGSRVSTDISLAGRFLVLVPLANYVAVSKKIYSFKERRRLRALARSLLPEGFGVIVRTVAEGKKAKELDTDLRLLLEKWQKIEKKLEGSPSPPTVVHVDANMASSVIRDLFSDDYDRILIDDQKLYKNVKNYIQAVAPHMVPAVQHHNGKKHVFKAAKIAHEIAQAFESRVDLPSGGYLFIEHTEAMHVVDVNSGRAGRGLSQEENSLKVDIEAVHAIAKQIRLRDLGGIIVIDFIDLREERNRKKIFFELRKAFQQDRAVTKILPMSDFGLVEITRQRLRPSITKTFSSPNKGAGSTESGGKQKDQHERRARTTTIEGFIEKIERWITSYKKKGKGRVLHLQVHSFTAAYLSQKIPAYPLRWFVKYFLRVKLKIDDSLDPFGFRFIDAKTGEDLSRRKPQRRNNSRRQGSRRRPSNNRNQKGKTENRSRGGASKPEQQKRKPSSKSRTQRDKPQNRQQNKSSSSRGPTKNQPTKSSSPTQERKAKSSQTRKPRPKPQNEPKPAKNTKKRSSTSQDNTEKPREERPKNSSRSRGNQQRRTQRRSPRRNQNSANEGDGKKVVSESKKSDDKTES